MRNGCARVLSQKEECRKVVRDCSARREGNAREDELCTVLLSRSEIPE